MVDRLINKIGPERILRFVDWIENLELTPRLLVKHWLIFYVGYTAVWTVILRAI